MSGPSPIVSHDRKFFVLDTNVILHDSVGRTCRTKVRFKPFSKMDQ